MQLKKQLTEEFSENTIHPMKKSLVEFDDAYFALGSERNAVVARLAKSYSAMPWGNF
jgi:hypothetical protein